jgi:hypothetical protein
MSGLPSATVDVFLSTMNQVPGKHQGPNGRLTELVDCIVRKYVGPGEFNERVVVEQRNGFESLTNSVLDPLDGSPVTVPTTSPEMIGSLDDQLVSISSQVPRVLQDVTNWSGYPTVRQISRKLRQEVMHTTDHTLVCPDQAQVGDMTGMVWTDQVSTDAGLPIGATYFGIKSLDGTWVLLPSKLYGPNTENIRTLAKVVSDGSRFWVFWNDETAGFGINVGVYSASGAQLATTRITQIWQETPGYWDITFEPVSGLVLLAQPGSYNPPNEVHASFDSFKWNGSSIVHASHADGTVHCQGPVAWLTNDLADGKAYLGTVGVGLALFGYQVDPATLTQTDQYTTGLTAASLPDSVTGWVEPNGINPPFMFLVWSELAPSQTVGPKFDPALRRTKSANGDDSGMSIGREIQSCLLVSRAFKLDNDYYAYTYYQSGSGLVLQQTPISVSLTAGDYMFGNSSQTVPVMAGDYTTGAPFSASGQQSTALLPVFVSLGTSSSIASGDTVGLATGGNLLQWTVAGMTVVSGFTNLIGSKIVVAGSAGVSGADGTYHCVGFTPPHTFFTTAEASTGATPSGTFTTAGTATASTRVVYGTTPNPALTSSKMEAFYSGGSIAVTGSGTADGTRTIDWMFTSASNPIDTGTDMYFAVPLGGEANSTSIFSAVVSPAAPNEWHISAATEYDASLDGANLVVGGTNIVGNDGSFVITNASPGNIFTTGTDAASVQPQIFQSPTPIMVVELALTQNQYQFFLQSQTLDYTFLNATVQVKSAKNPSNDGTYTINWLDPTDTAHHTFTALPTNGKTDQVNELFDAGAGTTIVIELANGIQPELQPCWFLSPLRQVGFVSTAQAGCFERGIAFADWRFEGQSGFNNANVYPMDLSSPCLIDGVYPSIVLPYRAKSFTAGQTLTTPQGTATSIVTDAEESTIGLKRFLLDVVQGQSVSAFNELTLPGPLAGGFTASGFHEQGWNTGPEAPFLVSEENDTGAFGVTSGQIELQVVWEGTDENGERLFSYPSPPLIFTLAAGNNTYTVGGRLPLPLDSTGKLVFGNVATSNRASVNISLYRTATIGGTPTVLRYKLTNDLNPNGLYNGTGPGSGFSFPDSYTWHYRDQSLDSAIVKQEQLYTSKGLLPRWPAPSFSQGDVWEDRTWLVAYDGAVWASGGKTEGDGNWYFPGFRMLLSGDRPVTVNRMEQYLVIGGQRRMWYIPAQRFPDNTGSSGSIPTPSPLPFPNGCTGVAVTSDMGVVYASTAGGVWLVTRALQNVWLSEAVKDDLTGIVTDLAVDQKQRIAVATGTDILFVYDPIPKAWYKWRLPAICSKLNVFQGQFVFQDTTFVYEQGLNYADVTGSTPVPVLPDLTLAGINFTSVRGAKNLWEMQLVGEYKGPHQLNAVLSYPDETGESPTSFGPYTPDPSRPYLLAINPKVEEAGQYGLRVFATMDDIGSPGNSFTLELLSCELGIDKAQGLFKLPVSQRIAAN